MKSKCRRRGIINDFMIASSTAYKLSEREVFSVV